MERSDLRETYTRATELYREKRYQEALALLRDLNEAFPGEPALLYSCALCLASLGRSMEAIGLCDRLIREHHDVRGVELRARIAAILADAEEQQSEPVPGETAAAPSTQDDSPSVSGEPCGALQDTPEPAQALSEDVPEQAEPAMPEHAADDVELLSDEVLEPSGAEPRLEPAAPARRRRPGRPAIAAALLLLAAAGIVYWQRTRPASPPAPSPTSAAREPAPRTWAFGSGKVYGDLAWREHGAAPDTPWTALGLAQGEVALPPDAALRLMVHDHHWLDPEIFRVPAASLLRELNLETRFLTDAAAEAFPRLPGVRTLRIAGAVGLSDAGLTAMLAACQPESLILGGLPLATGESIAALANHPQLTSVDLGGTRLAARDIAPLAGLPALTALWLPASADADVAAAFADTATLERLSLGAPATGSGVAALGELPALRRVELRAGATAAGLSAVVALPHLKELAAGGPLENGDLRPLDSAVNLRTLELRATPVDADTAPALAGLHQLESLLIDLPAGSNAAPALAETASRLPRLHTLALLRDAVGDGALPPLADAATLHTLDLSGTRVTAEGLAGLAQLPALRTLVLDDTAPGDDVAEVLAAMGALREVSLVRAAVGSAALERLRNARPDLAVQNTPARDVRYVGFPSFEPLGTVYTTADAASDAPLALVGRGAGNVPVPRGRDAVLVLAKPLPEDGAALEAVAVAGGGVQGLVLRGEAPSAAGLAFAARLPALERLTLDGPRVTDSLLAALRPARTLERLDIENSAVTAAGVSHATRALPDLLRLRLRGSAGVGDEALQPVSTLHRLQWLDLRETAVTDAGLERLRPLLALERVLLEGTGVTPEGVAELRKALPGATVTHDARAFETLPVEEPPTAADAP